MNFVGEYTAKLDDKGRLVFPSAFKSLCGSTLSAGFVVKKNLFADCLEIFAYSAWERESEAVKAKLNPFKREHDLFWRSYMKNRAFVVPDEKLGRISIPKDLLDSIGVIKEVVFCGKDFKIELWAKEKIDESSVEGDDFVALAEEILG